MDVFAEGTCGKRVLKLKPDQAPTEINLPLGATIAGMLTKNGNPSAQGVFAVAQTHRRVDEQIFLKAIPATLDANGYFKITHLPPDQQYCIYSIVGAGNGGQNGSVLTTRVFDAPSSGQTLYVGALELVESLTVKGRLQLPDGEPPTGKVRLVFDRDPAWDWIEVTVDSRGAFDVTGLTPELYEMKVISSDYELDSDRFGRPQWSETSTKVLIDRSINNLVIPIRSIDRSIPDIEPHGAQTLKGRVTTAEGKGVEGIRIDASMSVESLGKGLGNRSVPWTTTADDGRFLMSELPDVRLWLKIYRPDDDGMRIWYLGMVKPQLNAKDVSITLSPEMTFQLDTISGRVK